MSIFELKPKGLFDPFLCKKKMCSRVIISIIKGKIKCKEKNRIRVGFLTEKDPHNQKVILFPMYGIDVIRLVMTVAPQNLICPQGRT